MFENSRASIELLSAGELIICCNVFASFYRFPLNLGNYSLGVTKLEGELGVIAIDLLTLQSCLGFPSEKGDLCLDSDLIAFSLLYVLGSSARKS